MNVSEADPYGIWGRIYAAVDTLVSSESPLPERVAVAWTSILPIGAHEFPEELRAEREKMSARFQLKPHPVMQELPQLVDESEAGEVARTMLNWLCRMEQRRGPQD